MASFCFLAGAAESVTEIGIRERCRRRKKPPERGSKKTSKVGMLDNGPDRKLRRLRREGKSQFLLEPCTPDTSMLSRAHLEIQIRSYVRGAKKWHRGMGDLHACHTLGLLVGIVHVDRRHNGKIS